MRGRKLYLLTGATGHLGSVLLQELLERGEEVRALALRGEEGLLPAGVQVHCGDLTQRGSLGPFLDLGGYGEATLLHCAAIVTIASRPHPLLWATNVRGTDHLMGLALERGVDRVVYVSSVHAIPERPYPQVIREPASFSPDLVRGQYAKSKAAAAQIVLDYASRGLNASIVHPSGIIGPGDRRGRNHMTRLIRAMASGRIPVSIKGGYDFVDSRDVAHGVLQCEERGRRGECYILSGHYVTVRELLDEVCSLTGRRAPSVELPALLARLAAPLGEDLSRALGGGESLLTPYSVYTLQAGALFSHEKASAELGYAPRDIGDSIRATLFGA